jgi:FlaA1/EpsC-like NDP-sugar epimerase
MEQFIRPKEERIPALTYDKQFTQKWVIITGSTGGIGSAIAKKYALLGNKLMQVQILF